MSQSITRQFLTFCKGKPAEERYDFTLPSHCAFAQFQKSEGTFDEGLSGDELDAVCPGLADELAAGDWTFGALASRLEAHLAQAGDR